MERKNKPSNCSWRRWFRMVYWFKENENNNQSHNNMTRLSPMIKQVSYYITTPERKENIVKMWKG